MQASGVLRDDAEPARLATALIAAVQGGYLLAQDRTAAEPMRVALNMALDYVRSVPSQRSRSGAEKAQGWPRSGRRPP